MGAGDTLATRRSGPAAATATWGAGAAGAGNHHGDKEFAAPGDKEGATRCLQGVTRVSQPVDDSGRVPGAAGERSGDGYTLVAYDAGSPRLEDAIRVYLEVFGGDAAAGADFVRRYAGQPDFRGLLAVDAGGRAIGLAFGHRFFPENWWCARVAEELGAGHPALGDAWVLVELGVVEPWRRRGVGTALHDAVLASQPCARAVLSTRVDNHGARRLYERLGWRYLHPGFVFREEQPPCVVTGKELTPA